MKPPPSLTGAVGERTDHTSSTWGDICLDSCNPEGLHTQNTRNNMARIELCHGLGKQIWSSVKVHICRWLLREENDTLFRLTSALNTRKEPLRLIDNWFGSLQRQATDDLKKHVSQNTTHFERRLSVLLFLSYCPSLFPFPFSFSQYGCSGPLLRELNNDNHNG